MPDLNKILLIGHLGRDAEMKSLTSGTLCKFSLATTEKWTDKAGVKREHTQWHRCVLWGAQAIRLAPQLTKGARVCVEGSVDYEEWEKDGQKRTATSIKAHHVTLLSRDAGDGLPDPHGRDARTADIEDSIPF